MKNHKHSLNNGKEHYFVNENLNSSHIHSVKNKDDTLFRH